MKDNEYNALIFISLMLAFIQSIYVEGLFEYYGYFIWFFIVVTFLYSNYVERRNLNQGGKEE